MLQKVPLKKVAEGSVHQTQSMHTCTKSTAPSGQVMYLLVLFCFHGICIVRSSIEDIANDFIVVYGYHLHLSAFWFPIVMIMSYRLPSLVCQRPMSHYVRSSLMLIWHNVRPIKSSFNLLCLELKRSMNMIKNCICSLDRCPLSCPHVDY